MRLRVLALVLLIPALSALSAAVPHLFFPSSLAEIESRHRGPFLLVLWSLDCPPCRREMQLLGETLKAHPDLDLVLVATDDPARVEEVGQVLSSYGLERVESWIFGSSDAQRLRYAIDPAWYGELPRSYFYLPDGRRVGHSGPLGPAQIGAWLEAISR